MIRQIVSFILFSLLYNSNSNQVRLEKQEKTKFEVFCDKLCPYLIIAFVIIISVLLFVALVKYGHAITGTEANQWYYHNNL